MKRVFIIDPRESYISDIQRTLIFLDEDELDVETFSDINLALSQLDEMGADEVVISVSLINSADWNIDVPVSCYAGSEQDIRTAAEHNMPCYGIIDRGKSLIEAIKENRIMDYENKPSVLEEENAVETAKPNENSTIREKEDAFQHDKKTTAENIISPQPENVVTETNETIIRIERDIEKTKSIETALEKEMHHHVEDGISSLRRLATENSQENRLKSRLEAVSQGEFAKDMGEVRQPAKCITIYSAKGGVGKTTIACELANYLALSAKSGTERYKVCLVDFNIDFGDVLNTLNFKIDGVTMSAWADDIKVRIEAGEKKEDIAYKKPRILNWLQQSERSGLYALLAPSTNVDSMYIEDYEIKIMLDMLINECDFDFIICDTGNNTRDSSFIALEKADTVFMILTQSVNTANCNNSFLRTAERVQFDTGKIKLIINKTESASNVGISAEEVEECFSYIPCIAKISKNSDIEAAGNKGEPLTYNPRHEFTKEIAVIASEIIGEQTYLELKREKRSFFSRMFSGKRGH